MFKTSVIDEKEDENGRVHLLDAIMIKL